MAARLEKQQIVQIGVESTAGTAVAQTVRMASKATFNPVADVTKEMWAEPGYLMATDSDITAIAASGQLEAIPNYEQLHVFLDSLLGNATATGSDPYTRSWTLPLTTLQTDQDSLTIATGDSARVESLVGAMASTFQLSGESGGEMGMSVDFVGRRVEDDTLDSLSKAAVNLLRFGDLVVSVATIGGSFTALNCDAKSVEFNINNGLTTDGGAGSLEQCSFDYSGDISADVTLVARAENATVEAMGEWSKGASPTTVEREIRLVWTRGSYSLTVVMTGEVGSVDFKTFRNGYGVFSLPIMAKYNSGSSLTNTALDITLVSATA